MKIIVVKADSIIRYALAVIAVIVVMTVLINIWGGGEVQVFGAFRKIPIYSVETSGKVASITFDCAWGADDIPEIVNTLEREGVKATFFIVGQWAEKYPDAVKLIAEKGHDVANHSYSHLRMGSIKKDKILSEISLGGIALEKIAGRKADLFRPPYGDYNNQVVEAAESLGYYTIQWDVELIGTKVKL